MMTPPKLAIPASANSISAEVRRLLRAAEVGGRLPTPKPDILECARLVETGSLDLEEYELSRIERLTESFHRAWGKIHGFFDRKTEEIYVDPQLHESKRIFVTYHEVSHKILPWQRVHYTEDDDATLSSGCEVLFESEANYGAAEIMFQCDRFELEARDFELSVSSALHLAEKYDASCHSSLRRFVERNHRSCLLLVLKPTRRVNLNVAVSYRISHSIPSNAFTLQFGDPIATVFINPEEELGGILNTGSDGEMSLSDLKGFSVPCTVEVFTNQYQHFAMVYPKNAARARKKAVRVPSIVLPGLGSLRKFGNRI